MDQIRGICLSNEPVTVRDQENSNLDQNTSMFFLFVAKAYVVGTH